MGDLNRVMLKGRLGGNPEKKTTKTGRVTTTFSLATARRVLKGEAEGQEGTYVEETEWHNITTWGSQAESCAKYLKKGSSVFLEGSIRSRPYEGKDGVKRWWTEVKADSVSFLSASLKPVDPAVEAAIEEVAMAS